MIVVGTELTSVPELVSDRYVRVADEDPVVEKLFFREPLTLKKIQSFGKSHFFCTLAFV